MTILGDERRTGMGNVRNNHCDFCGVKDDTLQEVGVRTEYISGYVKVYLCKKCRENAKDENGDIWKFLF